MSTSDPVVVRIRITGRVQGVGFRAWTARQANSLGVSGWVRNCASGEVEALLSGSSDDVEALLTACRRGPSHALVASVDVIGSGEPATGAFTIWADRSN